MAIRTLLLSAAAAFTLLLSSCVREYTCQCTIKYSGHPGLPDSSTVDYPIRDTKKNAEELCSQNSVSSSQGGISTDEKCELF